MQQRHELTPDEIECRQKYKLTPDEIECMQGYKLTPYEIECYDALTAGFKAANIYSSGVADYIFRATKRMKELKKIDAFFIEKSKRTKHEEYLNIIACAIMHYMCAFTTCKEDMVRQYVTKHLMDLIKNTEKSDLFSVIELIVSEPDKLNLHYVHCNNEDAVTPNELINVFNQVRRTKFLTHCMDKNTLFGKKFWESDDCLFSVFDIQFFKNECSLEKGILKKICELSNQRNYRLFSENINLMYWKHKIAPPLIAEKWLKSDVGNYIETLLFKLLSIQNQIDSSQCPSVPSTGSRL